MLKKNKQSKNFILDREVLYNKSSELKRLAKELENKYQQVLGQLALIREIEQLSKEVVVEKQGGENAKDD